MRSAALLLVALATVTPTSSFPKGPISARTSHEIVRLDSVATQLAGRSVHVDCWSNADWTALLRREVHAGAAIYADAAAFTNIAERQIQISPPVCARLADVLAGTKLRELDVATDIGVLAHEARHARGIRSESLAECGAMQTLPRAARLLGVDAAEAARLPPVYRGMIYPYDEPQYRSASCRAGLPGIVVPNEFGPDADVAALGRRLAAVAAVLPAWQPLPVPSGSLTRCSAVRTRVHEVARVERLFAAPGRRTTVDAAAVEFDSDAEAARVAGRFDVSLHCFAAAERVRLRRTDPNASVTVSRRGDVLRVTARGAGVVGSTGVVDDELSVRSGRTIVLVDVASRDRPAPAGLERLIFAAARS